MAKIRKYRHPFDSGTHRSL